MIPEPTLGNVYLGLGESTKQVYLNLIGVARRLGISCFTRQALVKILGQERDLDSLIASGLLVEMESGILPAGLIGRVINFD